MKSAESGTAPHGMPWTTSQRADVVSASDGARRMAAAKVRNPPPSGALRETDHTRAFLHQLSQTLTSLRGTLELALLGDGDALEYRKVIRQSLAQAEDLVQLLKSFRASAERTEGRTCE
jgi:signal transduction histidine kinase